MLKQICTSNLARAMLFGFAAIALLEMGLLAFLSNEVLRANASAYSEFKVLELEREVGQTMSIWSRLLIEASSEGSKAEFMALKNEAKSSILEVRRLAVSTKGVEALADELNRNCTGLVTLVDAYGSIPSVSWWNQVSRTGTDLLSSGEKVLALLKAPGACPYDESGNKLFFVVAISLNVFALASVGALIHRFLITPVNRLAEQCSRLQTGELMDAPVRVVNEIGSLEQSFHDLSVVIQENDRRRANNLMLFTKVQGKTLDRIGDCLDALVKESSDQRTIAKVTAKQRVLVNLKSLVNSMTDSLKRGIDEDVQIHPGMCSVGDLVDGALASTSAPSNVSVECIGRKSTVSGTEEDSTWRSWSVVADQLLISRVLMNFLSNALKYSPPGGTVTLAIESSDANLRFCVADEGPGISAEGIAKLFQPFSQLKSLDGVKRSGTGLGLVICKEIVEKHGGSVGCDSTPGKGSTFWLLLPLRQARPAVDRPSSIQQASRRVYRKGGALSKCFALMLVTFVIPQLVFLWQLQSRISEVTRTTADYRIKKQTFIGLNDLLFEFSRWRGEVSLTFENNDLAQTMPELINRYLAFNSRTREFARTFHADEQSKALLRSVLIKQKLMLKTMKHSAENFGLQVDDLDDPVMNKGQAISDQILTGLNAVIAHESRKIEASYNLSEKVSKEILFIGFCAAVFDVTILLVLALIAIRITERIATLKQKAELFASERHISPAPGGNDELSFLDASLVEACNGILQAQEDRQMLNSVINHDLRTPLTSILLMVQMFMAGTFGELDQELRQRLAAAEADILSLLGKVNALLTLEKLEAGKLELEKDRFSIVDMVERVNSSLTSIASLKGCACNLTINGSVDPIVMMDAASVELILSAIILNAVEASMPGSTVNITISSESMDQSIRVDVSDSGPGIQSELQPRIFERFRFVAGKPLEGLGLPLAYRLARLNGSSLSFTTGAAGTVFSLLLPSAVLEPVVV